MIGERYDGDAGLQYLNARSYEPKLAMFIQPDWWEVMQPGVGTNRYSYAFDDPVNGMDAGGHEAKERDLNWFDRAVSKIGEFFSKNVFGGRSDQSALTDYVADVGKMITPGYKSSQNAISAYQNGDYGIAALWEGVTTAEVAVTILTGGEYSTVRGSAIAGKADATRLITTPQAEIPDVIDEKLGNIVGNIFSGVKNPKRVGDGSAMDAARQELETGQKIFGRDHVTKATENLQALQRWLSHANEPDSPILSVDKTVAEDLIDRLRSSLGYK